MAYTTQLNYETMRSLDSASLTANYQIIGTALLNPGTIVKMVNNSDVLVTVSIDGTNDHDIIPAGSFWLYDVTANSPILGGDAIFIEKRTQFYVKGSAGTGSIYLIVLYITQV